jgi:hypothetical protein
MTDGSVSGLAEVVDGVAASLAETERVTDPRSGSVELRRQGGAFVRMDPDAIHFRLDPAVAAAARRTPGVGASDLGAEWVAFRPSGLDRPTLDRASAWTAFAWRIAGADRAGR